MKPSFPALVLTWILLVILTLAGADLGDGASPGLGLTLIVATITALKGGMVIEEFLEISGARPGLRYPVRVFGLLVPVCMVLVYLYGPQIARLTSLTSG
jgi:hypothetical protein